MFLQALQSLRFRPSLVDSLLLRVCSYPHLCVTLQTARFDRVQRGIIDDALTIAERRTRRIAVRIRWCIACTLTVPYLVDRTSHSLSIGGELGQVVGT